MVSLHSPYHIMLAALYELTIEPDGVLFVFQMLFFHIIFKILKDENHSSSYIFLNPSPPVVLCIYQDSTDFWFTKFKFGKEFHSPHHPPTKSPNLSQKASS